MLNRLLTTTLLSLLISAPFAAVGCSEGASDAEADADAGDGDGAAYFYCEPADTCPPTVNEADLGVDGPYGAVSFREDIYKPYMQQACGEGSSCHGETSGSSADLYYGDKDTALTDEQISTLLLQLKSSPPQLAPEEMNIVPGDWQNSYMMAKLDGCQNEYGYECDTNNEFFKLTTCNAIDSVALPCGDGMPASEGDDENDVPFARTEQEREVIHKIRAWIAQGALDN